MAEYNAVVIGAGAAGLVSSYMCAAVKAKVALIEQHKMGGDCLNTGCVPSKALIRTARFVHDMRRHRELGVAEVNFRLDFPQIMNRVQQKIADIAPHDSIERYTSLGVECFSGSARLVDSRHVAIGDQVLKAKNIILALGASPIIPPLKGIEPNQVLSSENLWDLKTLPRRLLVLGGGPIGCEMAQAFARLGSEVTQIEMQARFLPKEDPDMAALVIESLKRDGVKQLTNTKAVEVRMRDGEKYLLCHGADGQTISLPFDEILAAVGRRANTGDFDWQNLGVALNPNGTFKVDAYLRTTQKNIFAVGDCVGPYQFTHAASHQAWYGAMNALFSPFVRFKVDYSVMPWCTFTDPEIAHVGLNEETCREQGIPYEATIYDMKGQDRAITESEAYGRFKVLTVPGKDKILGATIASHAAGELIMAYAFAMKHGLGLKKILGTVHPYPTLMEANKALAGAWTRPRVPSLALSILSRFHHWRVS